MTGQNESKVAGGLFNNKIDLCLKFRDCSGVEFFASNDKIFLLAATKETHFDFSFCQSAVPSKPQ